MYYRYLFRTAIAGGALERRLTADPPEVPLAHLGRNGWLPMAADAKVIQHIVQRPVAYYFEMPRLGTRSESTLICNVGSSTHDSSQLFVISS